MVTSEISKFEAKFLAHLRGSHSALLQKIRKEGKLDPVDEQSLNTILDAFIPDSGCAMKQ
jgi:F0F1-type ATP synthase alpha subunit